MSTDEIIKGSKTKHIRQAPDCLVRRTRHPDTDFAGPWMWENHVEYRKSLPNRKDAASCLNL